MTTPASPTIRILPADEIAARAGGSTPFLRLPPPTLFGERSMRLRQRAEGHAMGDYLRFVAALAQAQHDLFADLPAPTMPVPDAAHRAGAARDGVAPVPAASWPRGTAWHGLVRTLATRVLPQAPAAAGAALAALAQATAEHLDDQAERLLMGSAAGVDLAQAPLVAAALQLVFTRLLLDLPADALARTHDSGSCPFCGSRPVASVARGDGEFMGQRYLQCSLCSLQWHLPRAQCCHCGSTRSVAYQSLDRADADGASSAAARAVVQAETCDDCGHYLKFLHAERDPFVEPVADDLATLTLDLLVGESGKRRHGTNLMLVFADDPAPPGGAREAA